jgi:hypothetical protein
MDSSRKDSEQLNTKMIREKLQKEINNVYIEKMQDMDKKIGILEYQIEENVPTNSRRDDQIEKMDL